MPQKNTVFISDLHLCPENSESLEYFYAFLEKYANPNSAEALYILGDFFEAFIGEDNNDFFIEKISQSLYKLNIPVYLMQGNRDFLMGKLFAQKCNAVLLPDPVIIDLYGVKTLLTHGDLLCTQDTAYQCFRKFIRHPFIIYCILKLPLLLRRKLALALRHKSQIRTQNLSSILMDVCETTVQQWAIHYKIKQIIHGHTHKPYIHHLNNIIRFVLPAWHPKGGMIIANSDKKPELVIWDKVEL